MVYEGITITLIIIGLSAVLWSYYDNKTVTVVEKKSVKEDENQDYYEEYSARIEELNHKILELNEYGGFLKNELDNKHKELMFLYQLIHEKTKEIKENSFIESGEVVFIKDKQEKDFNLNEAPKFEVESDSEGQQINFNQLILELSEKGYTIKEIAQLLEIGQGEVKLVLDLYE